MGKWPPLTSLLPPTALSKKALCEEPNGLLLTLPRAGPFKIFSLFLQPIYGNRQGKGANFSMEKLGKVYLHTIHIAEKLYLFTCSATIIEIGNGRHKEKNI